MLAGCLSAHLLRKTALGSIEQARRSTSTPALATACAWRPTPRLGAATRRSVQKPAATPAPRRGRAVLGQTARAPEPKTRPTMPPRRKKDPPTFKPSAETLRNFQMPEETPQLELLPSGPKGDIPSTYTGECRALNQPAVLPPPPPPSRKEERPSASRFWTSFAAAAARATKKKSGDAQHWAPARPPAAPPDRRAGQARKEVAQGPAQDQAGFVRRRSHGLRRRDDAQLRRAAARAFPLGQRLPRRRRPPPRRRGTPSRRASPGTTPRRGPRRRAS